jgi:hypothetical protein
MVAGDGSLAEARPAVRRLDVFYESGTVVNGDKIIKKGAKSLPPDEQSALGRAYHRG